jgi:hypothetical protein
MESKRCTTCGEVKALTEFYKDARRKDGRYSECKACTAARRKADRPKARPIEAAWRARRRGHLRQYYKTYFAANKEKRLEAQRKYRAKKRQAQG